MRTGKQIKEKAKKLQRNKETISVSALKRTNGALMRDNKRLQAENFNLMFRLANEHEQLDKECARLMLHNRELVRLFRDKTGRKLANDALTSAMRRLTTDIAVLRYDVRELTGKLSRSMMIANGIEQ